MCNSSSSSSGRRRIRRVAAVAMGNSQARPANLIIMVILRSHQNCLSLSQPLILMGQTQINRILQ